MTFRGRIARAVAAPVICIVLAAAGYHFAHAKSYHFNERADWAASQADTLEQIMHDLYAMLISLMITPDPRQLGGLLDDFERDSIQRLGVLENQTAMELTFVRGTERDEEEPEQERPSDLRAQVEHVLGQMRLMLRIRMSADPMVDRSADLSALVTSFKALEQSLQEGLADESQEIAEARALSGVWAQRAYWVVIGGVLASLVAAATLGWFLIVDLTLRLGRLETVLTDEVPSPPPAIEGDELEKFGAKLAGRLSRSREAAQHSRKELTELSVRLERRSSELELSNARLREIDQTRRRFLGEIGHALKTPLTVARGSVENLAPQLSEQGAAGLRRALHAIDAVTERVTTLVSLARSDDGRVIGQRVTVELFEFLDSRVAALRILPGGERLDLVSELEAPLQIQCDPQDLERLCDAVLENALDHGDGPVRITLDTEPGAAVICVRDDGPGLDGQDPESIFERYRSDRGGHGIGLAMARQITQELGGVVTAHAPEAGGMLITIRLPVEGGAR